MEKTLENVRKHRYPHNLGKVQGQQFPRDSRRHTNTPERRVAMFLYIELLFFLQRRKWLYFLRERTFIIKEKVKIVWFYLSRVV